jgi:hypothetical protein
VQTTIHTYNKNTGQWVPQTIEVSQTPEEINAAAIRDAATTALADNRTFLAIASPTNAQTLAQVKALTRQINGLVRLILDRLDGTD